jgi:hypothetical protein
MDQPIADNSRRIKFMDMEFMNVKMMVTSIKVSG